VCVRRAVPLHLCVCVWVYIGSVEESVDLRSAYVLCAGEMDAVLSELKCCTLCDVDRHVDSLRSLINTGQLVRYRPFTRSANEMRRRADTANHIITQQVFYHFLPPGARTRGIWGTKPPKWQV